MITKISRLAEIFLKNGILEKLPRGTGYWFYGGQDGTRFNNTITNAMTFTSMRPSYEDPQRVQRNIL